jgi:DNA repair photolyase
MGYNLFFLFTINSVSERLEPNLPPLENRIKQMEALVNRFGSASVWWRFDPICFFQKGDHAVHDNLEDFPWIAEKIAGLGIDRCITSFMDIYRKVTTGPERSRGFHLSIRRLKKRSRHCVKWRYFIKPMNLSLYTCCENEVLAALPQDCDIKPGGCISNRYLAERFGGKPSFRMIPGSEGVPGCECMASRDIGGYDDQPCFHNCLYCYARPEKPEAFIENMNQTGKHERRLKLEISPSITRPYWPPWPA